MFHGLCKGAWVFLVLGTTGAVSLAQSSTASSEATSTPPFLSLDNGLASTSPYLKPGKVDLLYKNLDNFDQFNFITWTPTFKGGFGTLDFDNAPSTWYGGGYLRPLQTRPHLGELIVGGQAVDLGSGIDYEAQAEYRFPFGLGFGGGIVDQQNGRPDIRFAKGTFRKQLEGWHTILEVQGQEVGSDTSPGGYGAVYNDFIMGVAGTDGEQWRGAIGLIAPKGTRYPMLRPAAEALYVDTTIGDIDGPRVLFANASLGFRGGFLSHPARLGRAMGPQGLEYGNPLGFLRPTWNRRLDLWELGGLMNFRMEYIRFPNNTTTELYESVVYPFQWLDTKTVLDSFFAGGSYIRRLDGSSPAVQGGFSGKLSFLQVSVGVVYETDNSNLTTTVGLIDWF